MSASSFYDYSPDSKPFIQARWMYKKCSSLPIVSCFPKDLCWESVCPDKKAFPFDLDPH